MRGYPRGPLTKKDYENLLAMPEHAERAKEELVKLTAIDDSKVTIEQGTAEAPKLVQIDNPLPAWKRAGFSSKAEISVLAVAEVKPNEEP